MSEPNDPNKLRRIPKMSFNSKDLSRRMKKVEGATVKHTRRFVCVEWTISVKYDDTLHYGF